MALTARTLTGDLATLIGGNYDPAAEIRAWVTWRGSDGIIVDPSIGLRVGGYPLTIADDGSFSTTLPDSDEANIVYTFHVSYADPATGDVGNAAADFLLTASGALGSTVALLTDDVQPETVVNQVTDLVDRAEAAADLAEAISGLTGEDAAVALLIETPASDTAVALSTLVRERGPVAVNVAQYGVLTTNSGAQNDGGMAALFAAHTGPVTIAFPEVGRYEMSAPLPNRNNLGIEGVGYAGTAGTGYGTILDWISGSMLDLTTTIYGLRVSNVRVENSTGAAHIINITNASGGLASATFERVDMVAVDTGTSILHFSGAANLFDVTFDQCRLWRQATHTVPAINILTAGSGVNTCRWVGGWWHSNLCNTTPFLRAECSANAYILNFELESVIGEQNLGGMAHFYSASSPRIHNVIDWDTTGYTYTDDLFKVDTSGLASRGLDFNNSGTAGASTFAAGKGHLKDESSYSRHGHIVNGGVLGVRTSTASRGRVIQHGGGQAFSIQTTGVNHTVGVLDDVVVMTAAGATTATMPDPTGLLTTGTIPKGRVWTIKNTGTGTVTVQSAGSATIDGAASISLTQWQSARLITNGTNWLRL